MISKSFKRDSPRFIRVAFRAHGLIEITLLSTGPLKCVIAIEKWRNPWKESAGEAGESRRYEFIIFTRVPPRRFFRFACRSRRINQNQRYCAWRAKDRERRRWIIIKSRSSYMTKRGPSYREMKWKWEWGGEGIEGESR